MHSNISLYCSLYIVLFILFLFIIVYVHRVTYGCLKYDIPCLKYDIPNIFYLGSAEFCINIFPRSFNTFSIYEILPEIMELWYQNEKKVSDGKNPVPAPPVK